MPLAGRPLETPIHIPNRLRAMLALAPDDIALVSVASSYTWRELNRASDNLAGNLLRLGLTPCDRIASLMPNRPELIVHYIACMKSGFVAVPLNYRYKVSEIDRALAVSGASILLAHAEREEELAGSQRARELPLGLIIHQAEGKRHLRLEDLIATALGEKEFPDFRASDPAFIFFTSGSTGPAKGVTHSHESISWMFAATSAALELGPGDVMLPSTSLSHLGSFTLSCGALGIGARVVVAQSFDSQHILKLLREQRPTVLLMQPALLFQLVRDPDALPEDFRSLRLCRSAGDKVPAELAREFIKLSGRAINEGLGMTEAGLVTANPPSGIVKAGSVGKAVPGMCLSIRDDEGQELPPGAEGNLWISAPSLTIGYWEDPTAAAAVMRDGWFDTGDVVKADGEGYLTFCGRKKQLIVHDASNISPQEVEDALLQHTAVASAGVVGVRDLVHGENVLAYVTLKPGVPAPTELELIDFARARVGYKAPEKVEFLAEMLLNAGKVDRAALKLLAAARDRAEAR
jgi:long-chain acyl-CoA synthetase